MKRMILTAVSISLFTGTSAIAAEVIVEDNSSVVKVEEKINTDTSAMLVVVKSGESIEDNDNIYAVKYAEADENDKAVWEFEMPEKNGDLLTDGEYDLYIKQDGYNIKIDTMTYSTVESRKIAEEKWQAVDSSDALTDVLNDKKNSYAFTLMGFDMNTYYELKSEQNDIAEIVIEETGDFSDKKLAECADIFNSVVGFVGINTDADNTDKYISLINPEFEDVTYNQINDEKLKKWISEYIGKIEHKSVDDFEKEYVIANILYIINNTRVSDIEDVLDKYAEELGIENNSVYKKYLALKSKSKTDENIVNSLGKSPAKNIEDLKDIIDDSIVSSESNKKGNSGGGGGGASYGGGVSTTIPTVEDKDAKPENALPEEEVSKKTFFNDMDSVKWAEEAVNKMAEAGVVSGDENGNFRPNDIMKREEFVKMLVMAANAFNENADCEFDDVAKDAWYFKYVASAYEKGLVFGVNDTKFGIGNNLTRQDMAVLCKRAADTGKVFEPIRDKIEFTDDTNISDYAKEAVYALYTWGAVNGVDESNFSPLTFATRAQGAMIIYNLFLK